MKKQFLETGKIVATHGIRGEVRVQPWSDEKEFLTRFDVLYLYQGKTVMTVEQARVHKNVVVIKFQGIETMEQAQSLRNQVLYFNRNDVEMEADTYFIQDLLGSRVVDFADGSIEYGVLTDITETGANDVYHIKRSDGVMLYAPAIPDVLKEIDADGEIIRITPLEGLFDDED